jgi:hypothetical protein
MSQKKLEEFIESRISQPTVILCFKVILENHILYGYDATITKSEVNKKFDLEHKKYGVQSFRSDYLLRQTGQGKNNVLESNSVGELFFIKKDYLNEYTISDLKTFISNIEEKYLAVTQLHKSYLDEFKKVKNLDFNHRKEFIIDLLLNRETDRRGQNFEVTAFSILKVFYQSRGFELNRFSTIYSNDGGIDYTSQSSIYQVTTQLTNKKFEEDIAKAPLKKRIFVFRESASNFDWSNFDSELVTDYISKNDLLNHLEYMCQKNPDRNTKLILDVITFEFEREYYL